jgi:hypothetical protein
MQGVMRKVLDRIYGEPARVGFLIDAGRKNGAPGRRSKQNITMGELL